MKSFRDQNYYELLEVSATATSEEIRAAYQRQLEQYGPDSVALYGLIEPAQAEELRARLLEAMEILCDDDLRGEYDRSIGLPERKKAPLTAEEAPQPTQLAMTELLATAEAVHSTHPEYAVSYIPHPPRPDSSFPLPLGEGQGEGLTLRAEPAERGTSSNESETRVPHPNPLPEGEGVPEADADDVQDAAPSPPPEFRRSISVETALLTGAGSPAPVPTPEPAPEEEKPRPPPLPTQARAMAPEIAQETAIATAESALAQVRARETRVTAPIGEPRPKPLDIPPDAEFNGELLRQVRQSRGIPLERLSERTRIAQRHLENIEADRYDALPATVYLRGMLMSLSRELGLDGLRVAKSYLELVAKARGQSE